MIDLLKKSIIHKIVIFLWIIATLFSLSISIPLFSTHTKAATGRDFSARFTANVNGDIKMVGNVLLTCPLSDTNCTKAHNATTDKSNNNFDMQYIDIDKDSTTFDSSSATLSLPTGASILWAGIYWGGVTTGCTLPSCDLAKINQTLIATPGTTTYTKLTATTVDTIGKEYTSFVDITSLVQSKGNGTYTIANVQSAIGSNTIALWNMAIVYKDSNQPFRNLNVYDGLDSVGPSKSVSIPISGFVTPISGSVTAHLGLAAFDGDLGLAGDSVTLNSTKISDALNPSDNVFNSTATYLGTRISNKNPDYINQLGYDHDIINASNIIPNNAKTATVNFSETGALSNESYFIFLITLSVDVTSQVTFTAQCPSKDTYTFNVKSATNLTNNIYKNQLYIAPKGTSSLLFQPQPGNSTVDTSIDKTINIMYEKSGTYTGMRYYTYTNTGWAKANATYVKAATSKSNTTSQSPPTFSANDRYYLSTNSFTSGQTSDWTFTVKFNTTNSFFTNFYNKGFEVYLYMNDYLILNYATDSLIPANTCGGNGTSTFYTTGNGDYRSHEPGYNNKFTVPSVKFWAVGSENNDTLSSTDYVQYRNPDPATSQAGLDISDFGFEWKNPGTIDCQSEIGNQFCNEIPGSTNVSQKNAVQSLNTSIDNAVAGEQVGRTEVVTPNFNLVASNFYDSSNKTIYLNRITTRSPILIDIDSSITSLTVVDSNVLNETPDVIIIRSLSTKCALKIQNIDFVSGVTTSGTLQVGYNNSTVSQLSQAKTRLYINYDLNTPSGSTINNKKKIILTSSNTTKNSYYLGSMITSGLLYTDTSSKTNVVKGNIISKGIAARSTGTSLSTMYFKDSPNPFLYIDYDPKLMLSLKYLLTPIIYAPRSYVGL